MAGARISVIGEDGGLGYRGPDGPMTWAAFGVCSLAAAIADQEPLTITSPDDAEELLGTGPLRDLLVCGLTGVGTSVVVLPLVRTAGGTVLGTAARSSGSLDVTAVAGWSLGLEDVTLRWSVAGIGGTAALQLIINGRAYPAFVPLVAAYASPLVIPEASLGPLANGVATADRFSPTVTAPVTGTPAVVGDSVDFQFGEPSFASTDVATAVARLGEHQLNWRHCEIAGFVSPAVWTSFDTAIRLLENDGRYVRGYVQLAGPQLVSGASAATATPAWNSAQLALTGTPARVDNPRTGAVTTWMSVEDPIQGRTRVLPATYGLAASMSARQSWEPPDATKHGPMITDPRTRTRLLKVFDIHPADFTPAQRNSQDDIWLTTLRKYSGRGGVYPTHLRLWGQFPQSGITGSDYIGVERGFLMDEICTDVYNRLFEFLNENIPTGPDGRISDAAKNTIEGVAQGGIDPFISVGAIAAGDAIAMDKDPGILTNSTVIVRLRIQPHGKAEVIEAFVGYVAGLNIATAEVAEAA